MCGIAGIIASKGASADRVALERMAEALAHRGPDDGAIWVGHGENARVGLAHRRLSILDIAGGKQPMGSRDGAVQVVFNGQIYNHLELRAELVAAGHTFVTDHSDTEVLVHGMRAWAATMTAKLAGMFAFCAADTERRTLLLARDPMGKKPLYVATRQFFEADAGISLAFASELSALAQMRGARRTIDVLALSRFLAFDFVPDPDCIYEGVLKIPPGMQLHLNLDELDRSDDGGAVSGTAALTTKLQRYGELAFASVVLPASAEARTRLLRDTIEEAVRTRLVADVPVGVFLSGGLDSSLVAALASRHTSRLETFSIGFREKSFDESSFARTVATHIGSRHHEETLDEHALLDVLPRVADDLSEPFADHSVVPTFMLARFARQSVKVALGGDGGDELFLGYPTFVAEALRPRAFDVVGARARPAIERLLQLVRLLPVQHGDLSLDFKARQFLLGLAEPHALRRHQLFLTGMNDDEAGTFLRPEARQRVAARTLQVLDDLEVRARAAGARDVFDILTFGYAKTYMAAGVLQKIDRATMAVGLEARAPLLDRRVVALALSLPTEAKLHHLTTKIALKRAARGLIPDSIIDRRKKGFGMPVASWLIGPLRPFVEDLLSPEALRQDEHLDGARVRTLVDEHMSRRANHRKTLWALLMYRWWRMRVHARLA